MFAHHATKGARPESLQGPDTALTAEQKAVHLPGLQFPQQGQDHPAQALCLRPQAHPGALQ